MTGTELAGLLAELGGDPAWLLGGILLATFVLEDAATIAAALLAAQGLVDPTLAVAVLCAGTGAGDIGLHLAGRWARRHRWVARQCARPAVARAADWLSRRRWPALILARFVPGLRLPTYLASGLLGVPLAGCAMVIAAATVLWTPGLFLLGMAGWTVVSSIRTELGLLLAVVTLLPVSCVQLCRWERRRCR
jgi:membrane protein DedA with SNARE-associated domain